MALFVVWTMYRERGGKALLRPIKDALSLVLAAFPVLIGVAIFVGGGAFGFWLLLEGLESTGLGIFDQISTLFPLRNDGEWLKGWLHEEAGVWGGWTGFVLLILVLHLIGGACLVIGALWAVLWNKFRNKFRPEEDRKEVSFWDF